MADSRLTTKVSSYLAAKHSGEEAKGDGFLLDAFGDAIVRVPL